MKESIDRREFVRRTIAAGTGIIAASPLASALESSHAPVRYDLWSVVGDRYFDNTMKALNALGGMQKFVQRGNTVGILVNSPLTNVGAFTKPDITLAIVKMCLDAGAKRVYALNNISQDYWRLSKLSETMRSEIDRIQYSDEMTEVAIKKGKALKKAEISKALLSCHVYINLPIVKDHTGIGFSGSLKNVMGTCSKSTCRRFHEGGRYKDDIEFLAQSIADVNLIRRPDLCVVDATEFLVTNGPWGPGKVLKPREVIATTNDLAADMYSIRHLGLNWEELPVIRCAQHHGYGPRNLEEITIHTM